MKQMQLVLAGLSLAASASVAVAATPAVIAAISARQGNFKEMAGDFKMINDQFKSGSPDWAIIRKSARDLATRAPGQAARFVRGSGPEAGVRTRALPVIWSDAAGFARAHADFVRAAGALDAAAQRGDAAGLVSARAALGATCKGCHDKYRATDE